MEKNYEYFMTVAEEMNFTKAAEKLFVSQPAISKYISRLEESLGIALFDRSTTPLKLTYAGELYRQYLEDSRILEKQLLQKFTEISNNERGQILMGITSYRGSCMLPEVLPRFQARYPYIKVILTEGINTFLLNEVLNERIQFCISDPIDTINYNLFDHDTIFHEKIYLAIGVNCPFLRRYVEAPEKIQALNARQIYPMFEVDRVKDEQFFLTNTRQSMSYVIESRLSKNKIHLSNVFRSANLTTAINLAVSGMGFTFVPEFSLRRKYYQKDLLLFNVTEPPLSWEHAVFYKKDSYVSHHCKLFIQTLKDVYKNTPD